MNLLACNIAFISIPVFIPIPDSMYKTSSVATLPVAPLAKGQPPRPATEESMTETPIEKGSLEKRLDLSENTFDFDY